MEFAAGQPTPIQQQVANSTINEATLRADVQFLSDDLLEGRGPGSRGDQLAQRYIVSQFQSIALEPAAMQLGGQGRRWVQEVPLVGVTTQPSENMEFRKGEHSLELKHYDDFIATCGKAVEDVQITDAEILFVGYGIQAPEFEWDDFKDVDVRGKILLFMNNDPSDDPKVFAGRRRLYYGRWDYKYAKAAERGAVGALIIHTTSSASYPYQVDW